MCKQGGSYTSANADELGSTGILTEVAAYQDWICRAESLICLSRSLFLGLTIVQKALKERPEHSRVWGQVLRGDGEGNEHRGSSTRAFPSVLFLSLQYQQTWYHEGPRSLKTARLWLANYSLPR